MYTMYKDCAVYKTTNFIGKRWTLLILLELHKGKNKWKRYSELKNKLLEITPKILSLRLKELEKEKLIKKKINTEKFPIKCQYCLTKSGKDFIKIIKDIKKWSLKWKFKNKKCEEKECEDCEI